MKTVFALVDCNSFYCSCEVVFDPTLRGKPLVVLSNNDGCIIALNRAAKKLGIPMGQPEFQSRPHILRHGVQVRSANFPLYGDMSQRVMNTLATFSPEIEVYSIDECFLAFREPVCGYPQWPELARHIRTTILRHTGIPVSIGMAHTKTLAKAANRTAKNNPESGGIHVMLDEPAINHSLARMDCADLWGVGRRHTERLRNAGIRTALDLKHANLLWIRRQMSVTGERTVRELNGIPCLQLEDTLPDPKSVSCTRSFGTRTGELVELEAAVATFAARAAEKLRTKNVLAGAVLVFLETAAYHRSGRSADAVHQACRTLPVPSQDSPSLIAAACQMVREIHRPQIEYTKAGVVCTDLCPTAHTPQDLFLPSHPAHLERLRNLHHAVDHLNRTLGTGAIQWGSMAMGKKWEMRQNNRSPAWTTRWEELPIAKAA